jgi:hypothetical protein
MFLLGHTPKSFQTLYFEISSTGKPMAWGFHTLEKHLAFVEVGHRQTLQIDGEGVAWKKV